FIDIIVTPVIPKAFRLRMSYDGHLRTDHFKVFKVQIRTTHVKNNHSPIGRFYRRHIKYGTFAFVAKIMDSLVFAGATFAHIKYMCPNPAGWRHDLFRLNAVCSTPEINRITWQN